MCASEYMLHHILKFLSKTLVEVNENSDIYIFRFILGFLCLLVELGIFIKIKLSFLVVGHTHEDIDQVFSR